MAFPARRLALGARSIVIGSNRLSAGVRAPILFLLLIMGVFSAWAAKTPPASPAPTAAAVESGAPLERAIVEAKIAAVTDDKTLAAEERERLLAQYQRVLEHLTALTKATDALSALREQVREAPGQTEAIRERLQTMEPLADPPVVLPDEIDLAGVQRLLAQDAADVATLGDRLSDLERGLTDDAEAWSGWPRDLAELRQRATDLEDELAGVAAVGAAGPDVQLRRWLLMSERDRLRAEAQVLEQTLQGADARRALSLAQRDETERLLDRAKTRQTWLLAAEDLRRRAKAEQTLAEAEAAKEAVADAHPQVRKLARANAALAERINLTQTQTAEAEAARAETAALNRTLKQDFANDRQRIDAAGFSRALGRALVDQRERLPNLRDLSRQASERADAEAEGVLNQLHWHEERLALKTSVAVRFAAELTDLSPAEAQALTAQLDEQIQRRSELLERAIEVEDRHLRALAELDIACESLRQLTRHYHAFLDERLLWMRSHVPITQQSFDALPQVIGEVLNPLNWLLVAQTLSAGLAGTWTWWLGLLSVVLLLGFDRALRRRIRATADFLGRIRIDRFFHTFMAIVMTLLLAAPVSLLLALLGLILISAPSPEVFPYAVGNGLLRITPTLFCLRAFRMLAMPGGVAERHFRWRSEMLRRLRRYLDLAIWTLVPLALIAAVASRLGEVEAATLARLALSGVTLGFAVLLAGALHPTRGLVRDFLAAAPHSLVNRLRHLWYPLVIAVPLILAVLALVGFYYTAATLFRLWIGQFWLLLGLLLVHQSILRWLLLTRRQLALRAALERRTRWEAQHDATSDQDGASVTSIESEAEAIDLVALDAQTRRLVNALLTVGGGVGLWLLWATVLPALNVLESILLWGNATAIDGTPGTLPVTAADLGTILLVIVVATIAVRHLPALLEILLLKNTNFSAGGRYTLIALTGYVIIALSTLLVVGRLGLEWGQVQWLVAALSVGIGFGLQEIVANFISGLIILFERPIRVGDTITIGAHSGTVVRIEIRATTIRTWDQRELLIPNKQLITGEVINWTLTDQINRVDIPVSIAYGSDTELALRVITDTITADSRVMTDPAPLIAVDGFGERGLDIMLRIYLPNLTDRLKIRSEIIHAIDQRLRHVGIAIGLPRRDIVLRDDTTNGASARAAPGWR